MRLAGRRLLVVLACLACVALAGCVGTDPPASEAQPSSASGGPEGGFSDTHVFPGEYDTSGDFARPQDPARVEIGSQRVVQLESEVDGADIQVGFVRPEVPEGERVPVIAVATPYLPPLQDRDLTQVNHTGFPVSYGEWIVQTWVRRGYAAALVPVRGTADSGGCSDLLGPKETADVSQAVTWLGEREWSNGNVGMIGLSYDGSTPWAVAATGNPHLETIVPMAGISDLYEFVRSGTPDWRMPAFMTAGYYGIFGVATSNPSNGRSLPNTLEAVACPSAARGLAAMQYGSLTGERDPAGYFHQRNHRPGVEENYNGSVLVAHGLRDVNVDPSHALPWASTLPDHGIPTKIVVGQWAHTSPGYDTFNPNVRWDWGQILDHWFAHWLEGDERRDLGPRVQVQDTAGGWRSAEEWPAEATRDRSLQLGPEGELRWNATEDTGTVLVGPSPEHTGVYPLTADPDVPASDCQGCALFRSAPQEEELRFAGRPVLEANVTPTGPGGHLAAFLSLVHPNGTSDPLVEGQVDLRFAHDGDEAQPVVPGQRMQVRLVFQPQDAVVPAGARLELTVNQGSAHWDYPSVPTYPVRLHLGGGQSSLQLDAYEVSPGAVFTPPSAG